jgi:hypothetical protein
MTLIYNRNTVEGPKTHAFILGCGRFPNFGPEADRSSTVAGARAIANLLFDKRDSLVAPLATIHCLLSDPAFSAGDDHLLVPIIEKDPEGGVDKVDGVHFDTVRRYGSAWLDLCQPGDHLFFYMSSHGVADRDYTGAGLFEDIGQTRYNRWSQSLNINALATALPITGAGACWVFLDACQEIVPSLLGQYNGTAGLTLIVPTAQQLANTTVRTMSLAGSRFGQQGWAPLGPEPPYFTQAVIRAFRACIELGSDGNWFVTGQQLQYHVRDVADCAFGYNVETEPLSVFANETYLLRVDDPSIPVVVRTRELNHMAEVRHITCNGAGPPILKTPEKQSCFFEVPPDGLTYSAAAIFQTERVYKPGRFVGRPCHQRVELIQ